MLHIKLLEISNNLIIYEHKIVLSAITLVIFIDLLRIRFMVISQTIETFIFIICGSINYIIGTYLVFLFCIRIFYFLLVSNVTKNLFYLLFLNIILIIILIKNKMFIYLRSTIPIVSIPQVASAAIRGIKRNEVVITVPEILRLIMHVLW